VRAEDKPIAVIDNELPPMSKVRLGVIVSSLGYRAEEFDSPLSLPMLELGRVLIVAAPRCPPALIESIHAAGPDAIIIGLSETALSTSQHRAYLRAGTAGLFDSRLPDRDLAQALSTALRGFVVLPASIADGITSRLEEPPQDLRLSERDTEILCLLARGASLAAIATKTQCSERHLRRITADLLERIGAANRTHAAALATRWGLGV
jgi:DNA-binding NarL/FixJ family response regulator